MKRFSVVAAALLISAAALAADAYTPTDAERARWSMMDMKSWMIVFDAYKSDHSVYPAVKSVEQAVPVGEPLYMKHAPTTDAWGHPYFIESDATSFRVVSAGADGLFQTDDDIVATNVGNWPVLSVAASETATGSYIPTDAERARWTLADLRVIRTAVEGYAGARNEYPAAKTMEELRQAVQPNFIKNLPMHDAWGNPFLYERDDTVGYRVVSAGADGKFDRSTWSAGGQRNSFAEDAVATGNRRGWFRYWEMK